MPASHESWPACFKNLRIQGPAGRALVGKGTVMSDSTKFDKDGCVTRLTDLGCERRLAEAFADECTDLNALRRDEINDTKQFDIERCVKRFTAVGVSLPTAEALADMFADGDALVRGQRYVPPICQ